MSVDRPFTEVDPTMALKRTMEAGGPAFTMPELKERGWTEAIVRRLLGAPDGTMRNPLFCSGARMGLWRVDRVHAAQTSEEWAIAVDAAHERSELGQRSSQRRREKALQALDDLPVPLPDLDRETLTREARDHHNRARGLFAGSAGLASPERDPAFLNRICVHYLLVRTPSPRHTFGELVDGGVKIAYAEDRWRDRVLDAIRQQYPSLA